MTAVVLIGGGGHALVVASILGSLPDVEFVGYTDVEDRGSIEGAQYLGTDAALVSLRERVPDLMLALGVGSVRQAGARVGLVDRLTAQGFRFSTVISRAATVARSAELGAGTVVFPGAVVNPRASIGAYAIANTHSVIEHGVTLGEHVHVAPGAVVCADVSIGRYSMVGSGAVVTQGVRVAENCLIGAGAVVTESLQTSGTYVGCPARRLT